ncbi:hypothetical protein PHZ_c0526 [Phenylobacterium zucineum HLK1]|uniref:Serine protease n=1 Tax=Phenylobacterium zucineum (strain HLK1) TaxID=450851 RepID=B4REV2_PHEZH|nr:hypothetical protein PHZ_c0526 [Phenylobacterium zucineum HLK1]
MIVRYAQGGDDEGVDRDRWRAGAGGRNSAGAAAWLAGAGADVGEGLVVRRRFGFGDPDARGQPPPRRAEGRHLLVGNRLHPADAAAVEGSRRDDDRSGRRLRGRVRRRGLKAGSDPSNLFAEAAPTSGDLQVGALVKSADASYCENVIKTSGKVTLGVEWQIYSGLRREVVARIETTGTYEAKKLDDRSKRSLAQEAFAANVRSLLADERFRQVMADDPAQAIGSPATRFEAIQIVGPKAASVPLSAAVQSVAAVFAGGGHGSGFVVSSDGYLLTNQHVVGDAKYVKVRWADGFEALGEVVRSDRRRDVALIKTSAKATPLALRSSPAALGETVFAIGTPLDAKFQNTVTKGVVSASRTYDGLAFLQSDVGINPGNSGGPLLDEKGSVLGISVSTYQVNDAPTGLNLFIPIAEALDTLALRPAN